LRRDSESCEILHHVLGARPNGFSAVPSVLSTHGTRNEHQRFSVQPSVFTKIRLYFFQDQPTRRVVRGT
ncbi:MAG TPA: hypothetical protein VMS31_10070, partial [Pyrinomonadaceae bacterium]|nr:hypothetical protein [Pyrinomonadaceae bacterium]